MIDLPAIRRAVGVTQVELASRLGTTQGGVSRIERQTDWLLSTLTAYFDALGVDATLAVSAGEERLTYTLTEDAMIACGGVTADE
ncbi:helix-turn-helix domain-containing protein [Mycobacteroides abscessus subsp. abscessus]|uniref:helix-turn-helix domain-containing protein n=1 Tax=Mycobacteroides abscessus TaxID=36809 RepID=UPI0039F02C80